VLAAHPELAGRRVVLYAPTFRGRGIGKRAATGLDAAALRAALPAGDALVLKTHPNLDPAATPTAGYDVVADPTAEINDLLALTDILITDYSSSVIEFALLRRPIVLLVGDLAEYEVDPGLYLDYRTDMIGTQVTDTAGVIDAIVGDRFDFAGYDAFITRQLGAARGGASDRFVDRFLEGGPGSGQRGDTLPPDVRHE
jgi:CDP-glycerol glycerophosphotransferase (TagB/SpsB family)